MADKQGVSVAENNSGSWDQVRPYDAETDEPEPNYDRPMYDPLGYDPVGFHPQSAAPVHAPSPEAPTVHFDSVPAAQPGSPLQQPNRPITSGDLTSSLLLRPTQPPPTQGWRKATFAATGGRVNLGNSPKEQRRIELTKQVNTPLQGCYKIAVLSLKGGVGKTTVAAALGSTFGSVRGDRVIAVDANPDRGTLSQKVPVETPATVRNLLRDGGLIDKYSDVRAYTSQNVFRLEVLASESDPAVSDAFSGRDYAQTIALLERFYSIVLTDCGTGLMHSAMGAILAGADSLVVVSSGSVDGVRSASATLDWLDAHGYRDLVSRSVAVVNAVRPRSSKVDLMKVEEHFEQRCRAVRMVPFDSHLEEGAEVDLDRLQSGTRSALLELAAAVAADFPASSFGSSY